MSLKALLESNSTEVILSRLKENPHSKFTSLFKKLNEFNVFTSYHDSKLFVSSNNMSSLSDSIFEIKSILKENSVDFIKTSDIADEGICFSQEITLLKKDVEKYCGKLG